MGRTALPTELLELSGTAALQKARYADRANEPRDTPALDPEAEPACLDALEMMEWRVLVAQSHRGVLRESDSNVLIIAAKVMAAIKYCEGTPDNGLLAMGAKYLGLLGMTPVDRNKVSAPPKADAGPKFAKYGQPRLVKPDA